MAAQKFLNIVSGILTQISASVTGTANAIPSGDATGHLDQSWMPTGVGPESVSLVTSENLAAGDLVNIYSNGGVATARKADASAATAGKVAHGFVIAATTSPAAATVYVGSQQNGQVSGLTPGSTYYLSGSTPGGVTATPVSTSGYASQEVGEATAAGNLIFQPKTATVLA